MSHLTDDATIRGVLKELVEENGWEEVVLTLDMLLEEPSNIDDPEHRPPVPLSVDASFPRRVNIGDLAVELNRIRRERGGSR